MNLFLRSLQFFRDLRRCFSLILQPQGVIHEDSLTHSHALGIHHSHIVVVCSRHHGALVSARKLRGKDNNHHLLPGLLRLFKLIGEGARRDQAGLRQLVALNKHVVKFPVA